MIEAGRLIETMRLDSIRCGHHRGKHTDENFILLTTLTVRSSCRIVTLHMLGRISLLPVYRQASRQRGERYLSEGEYTNTTLPFKSRAPTLVQCPPDG